MPNWLSVIVRILNGILVAAAMVFVYRSWGELAAFATIGMFLGFLSDRISELKD